MLLNFENGISENSNKNEFVESSSNKILQFTSALSSLTSHAYYQAPISFLKPVLQEEYSAPTVKLSVLVVWSMD